MGVIYPPFGYDEKRESYHCRLAGNHYSGERAKKMEDQGFTLIPFKENLTLRSYSTSYLCLSHLKGYKNLVYF